MKNTFDLKDVQITDTRWKSCEDKNALFLSEMDPERILSGFRRTCGIKTDAQPYGGWEDSLIAGHGIGHYFSALGMRIACLRGRDENGELEESIKKAETIVRGLLECQEKLGNGFLSAATVQDSDNVYIQFDILEGRAEGKQWVPWYALHKVLQGLLDLWRYGEIEGAGKAATALADWVSNRVLSWDKATRKKVLSVEYGGMNETLYLLYLKTHNERYKKAAGVFDEPELYSDLLSFRNRLKGIHANTTIPKILGYLTGALAYDEGEEVSKRLKTAEIFWEKVIRDQSYPTGAIGDMEHFFADGLLDGSRTQCNGESCCSYNMLKLSQLLYRITGDIRYTDHIERTLWNLKLGSIGPDGGYTYFNPMATGYYRLYSPNRPEENPFWCCVGTGMEDMAKAADQICYEEDNVIYITQWISSDLRIGEKIYQIRTDFEKGLITITCSKSGKNIKLRIPRWIKNREDILPKGEEYLDIDPDNGKFELEFSMDLKLLELPDEPSAKGFSYGPFVLCVPLGEDRWGVTESAGIDVTAPAWKVVFGRAVKSSITYGKTNRAVLDAEYLTLPSEETVEDFRRNFKDHIRDENGELFLTGMRDINGQIIDLPLIPYFSTGNGRYGVYWYISSGSRSSH